ncbi:MAG TPA: alpha/beta fold hydrolase [Allosphingosinicella sp.]|nr:alpha/beta fold hydrolase [Allosphingosinicella sp.]
MRGDLSRRRLLLGGGALAAGALLGGPRPLLAQAGSPPAISTDPPRDAAHPARMEVLHIPSGGVAINGIAYLAAGAGPRPTLVLMHGLPGNEKNLDLAQAARRAGWHAVTFNYRGSWGSPGRFSFAGNLEDARAVLAFLRDPAHAARLGVDPRRIVLGGYSMGGWATALTAARDPALAGAILISAANMGAVGRLSRSALVALAADNMETLAGVTAESMADELTANADAFDWARAASGLARLPLLVLSSDDGLAPESEALATLVRGAGGRVGAVHVATDHGWSDRRIRLQSEVLNWLAGLAPSAR